MDTILSFPLFPGIGSIGLYVVVFVMAVEHCGEKFTTFVGIGVNIGFTLGEMLLALEAYYIRDWVTLQISSSIPWVVLVPLIWILLPESPRWLISKERLVKESEKSFIVYKRK